MTKKPTDANRPMRVLEKVLEGGLGAGNLGVVIARHGTGKVAVLTSIAIDNAMDGTNVLHVAVGRSVSHVRAHDDEVLSEICERFDLRDRASIISTVERHKQIYTFSNPEVFTRQRLRNTLEFLRDHAEFHPAMVEIEGWPDFATVEAEEIEALGEIARDFQLAVWVTGHTHRDDAIDERGIPEWLARVEEHFAVIMSLEPEAKHIPIRFVKVHGGAPRQDVHLEFDPSTLLIRWS